MHNTLRAPGLTAAPGNARDRRPLNLSGMAEGSWLGASILGCEGLPD